MKREIEFLLLCYDKYFVEKVITFANAEELKKHLITLLRGEDPPIEKIEDLSLERIIAYVNERWNVTDGDFWRIVHEIDQNGIAWPILD
jgi:hypothetical protein